MTSTILMPNTNSLVLDLFCHDGFNKNMIFFNNGHVLLKGCIFLHGRREAFICITFVIQFFLNFADRSLS